MGELKPIRAEPKERDFKTYDMEWVPSNPDRADQEGMVPLALRLVGVYDGEEYRSYRTIEAFLRGELTPATNGTWLYAHAGGSFDMRYVLEYLVDNPVKGLSIKCAFKGSSAVIVELKRGKNRWFLLDSYFLIRESLRNIAMWMGGTQKGGSSGHCNRCGGPCLCIFYAPYEELREYNRDDVVILWDAIQHFQEVVMSLGGQLEMTVASTAMGLFRRAYLSKTISTSQAVNEIARQAYIASRVEVLANHVRDADYYDINSSFPYEMTHPVPGNLLSRGIKLPWRKDSLYLAEATIIVPDCDIPPLPYRSKSGRIFFPKGRWRSWFSNIDLEFLEERGGRIENVGEVLEFEPFHDLAAYAEDIYAKRVASTSPAEKKVLKILLNSLYGKFAESPEKQQMIVNPPLSFFNDTTEDADDGSGLPVRSLAMPGIWEYTEIKHQNHVHVPISVHITARARRAISRHMMTASEAPGGAVYYCDTDGIAVPQNTWFDTSNDLGGLKREDHIHEGTFAAPKLYAHRDSEDAEFKIRAKGFSRVLEHEDGVPTGGPSHPITYPDFCRLLEHKEIPLDHFKKIRESMKGGSLAPEEVVRNKTFRGTSRPKRDMNPAGTSSKPWDVDTVRED